MAKKSSAKTVDVPSQFTAESLPRFDSLFPDRPPTPGEKVFRDYVLPLSQDEQAVLYMLMATELPWLKGARAKLSDFMAARVKQAHESSPEVKKGRRFPPASAKQLTLAIQRLIRDGRLAPAAIRKHPDVVKHNGGKDANKNQYYGARHRMPKNGSK